MHFCIAKKKSFCPCKTKGHLFFFTKQWLCLQNLVDCNTVEPAIRRLEVPKSGRKFFSLCLHCILKRASLIQSRTTMKVSNIVAGNTWIIPIRLNSIIQEYVQLVNVNKLTGLLSPLSFHEWYASIMHEYQCSTRYKQAQQQLFI